MNTLFIDRDGKEYTIENIVSTLHDVGADDCEVLFIHSDIVFGSSPKGFNKREYLQSFEEAIRSLGVDVIFPTFSYSFCNGENYDVLKTKSRMGALSEYYRKLEGRYRTLDPLLSVSIPNRVMAKFDVMCDNSLGDDSALDIIHNTQGVKFLFLGVPMGTCFTYLHYIEKKLDVPYRFDMPFEGTVVDYDRNITQKRQSIHTACYGVKPKEFYHFEDYLESNGLMKKKRLGDKYIECISEVDAYREITNKINNNINYFLEKPFTDTDLVHKYTMDKISGRVTHC